MSRYLTNMTKESGLAERVAKAAAESGIDIQYRDHPMPADDGDWFYDDGYDPRFVPNACSLEYMGGTPSGDFTTFWNAFEALK